MTHTWLPGSVIASLALAPALSAQTFTTIVKAGDTISGVGTAMTIYGLAVDDSGHVLVNVLTDNPNPNINGVVIDETGAVVFSEGQSVSQPPGATVLSYTGGAFYVSGSGIPALWLSLVGSGAIDRGLYYGRSLTPAVIEAQPCIAPQLPSGSSYFLMLPPRVNNSNHLFFHSVIDDPNVAGFNNIDALMKVDPIGGAEIALFKDGDILPGHSFPILSFEWGSLAVNDSGQVMYGVGTAADANVNRLLYIDNTLIAQKSTMSPFGSFYLNLATSTLDLDLNNNGEYVFSCLLNDIFSEYGIVVNGQAFVQKNDTLPAIAPFKIEHVSQPIYIGDDGRILWGATWLTPGAVQRRGLFVDYTLLVEQGSTVLEGQVVTELTLLDHSFTASPSGQYLLFQAKLANIGDAAFLINLWQ